MLPLRTWSLSPSKEMLICQLMESQPVLFEHLQISRHRTLYQQLRLRQDRAPEVGREDVLAFWECSDVEFEQVKDHNSPFKKTKMVFCSPSAMISLGYGEQHTCGLVLFRQLALLLLWRTTVPYFAFFSSHLRSYRDALTYAIFGGTGFTHSLILSVMLTMLAVFARLLARCQTTMKV